MKPAREPGSSRPKLCASLKNAPRTAKVHDYHSILLCESERKKVHNDRRNQLSVERGKSGSTITIMFMVFTGALKNGGEFHRIICSADSWHC